MNLDQIKNLNLPTEISNSDINMLTKLLEKVQNGKGISIQERNNLLSKLSAGNILEENKKELKDMSEFEKKANREENLKKLKAKQNMLKQARMPKSCRNNINTKINSKIENNNSKIENIDSKIKNINTEIKLADDNNIQIVHKDEIIDDYVDEI
jgi:hypothetical protein